MGSSPRILLLAAVALSLVACSADPSTVGSLPSRPRIDPSLSPTENLRQIAAVEAITEHGSDQGVALPPATDPAALRPRRPDHPRAFMLLDDALAVYREAAISFPEAPSGIGVADDEARRAAVRYYIRGRDAALQGNPGQAIGDLERALALDPADAMIRREAARQSLGAGRVRRAVELYGSLLALDSNDEEARLALALHEHTEGRQEQALGLLAPLLLEGRSFGHDPMAAWVARHTVWSALGMQGYDRASSDLGMELLSAMAVPVQGSVYVRQVQFMHQRRGEMWRTIGDALCRIGAYDQALNAYAQAASWLLRHQPDSLPARVLYASLQLGRTGTAQYEFLAALGEEPGRVSRRDILLARYVAEHVSRPSLMGEELQARAAMSPDDGRIVRAAAGALADGAALPMLRSYVEEHPRDLEAVGDLLQRLARASEADAVDEALVRLDAAPDLAPEVVDHLLYAAPMPSRALAYASTLESAPRTDVLHARLLSAAGAPGEAWRLCEESAARWPDDALLLETRIELATSLGEPSVLPALQREVKRLDAPRGWAALARAMRARGLLDEAMDAALRAVALDGTDAAVLTQVAACALAIAAAEPPGSPRQRSAAGEAQDYANRALAQDDQRGAAQQVLLMLHGPGGPLEDPATYHQVVRQITDADPESALYARRAAREALADQRPGIAVRLLLPVHDTRPTDTLALVLLVEAWLQQNDAATAQRWLDARLAARPGNPALLEQWVGVTWRLGGLDEAISRLQAAWSAHPVDYTARRLLETALRRAGRVDEALELGVARIEARPPGVRQALEFASLYGEAGRVDAVIEQLRFVLDHAEKASLDDLASAVRMSERLEINDYRRDALTLGLMESIVQREPAAPLMVYASGLRALADMGPLDQRFDALSGDAAIMARGAGASDARSNLPWRDLAQHLIDAGRPDAAARALHVRLRQAPALDEEATSLLAGLAVVADAAGSNRATASIALLRELASRGTVPLLPLQDGPPSLAGALEQCGQIYTLLGDEDGTELLLRAVLDLDPENGMVMNNLGYAGIEAGRDDAETVHFVERAAALQPDDASVLDTIGWLRYRQGRYTSDGGMGETAAVTYLQRAVEAAGQPAPESLDHLGDALWRAGEHSAAAEAWRMARDLLEQPSHRAETVENFGLLQTRVWGLLVRAPDEMYDERFGAMLSRIREKLQAVELGADPPVAPTFAEWRSGTTVNSSPQK